MYRIFLNFVKSCISSCLSKFYYKKKFHRAIFEIKALKAEIEGAMVTYCWFSHDVTKFQTSEILILLKFYFHAV